VRIVSRLVLIIMTAAAVAVPAAAAARTVTITLSPHVSCRKHQVFVQLTDGSVVQVTHTTPGPILHRVTATTSDVFLVARIHAGWAQVLRSPGQLLTVTAAGPRKETWAWQFLLRRTPPLADPTDYVTCLRLRTKNGSFATQMHRHPGVWTFTAVITRGRLAGSTAKTVLPAL
jgi:hypothetical protein